jgi:radical SAM superfamily enzyme YgiQ (UPF0313 family)
VSRSLIEMRVLLMSTYELGHQPLHIASPAAALIAAGHEVSMVDLAVEELDAAKVDSADLVAISVPMHTAKRLANAISEEIKLRRVGLPIAHFGLYAGVGNQPGSVDIAIEGEYEPALVAWVDAGGMGHSEQVVRHLGRTEFLVPERKALPPLDKYSRLESGDTAVLSGSVEASHGCRHRCRHCPIPAVYDGRLRVVAGEVVLADIDGLVLQGAGHVTFADADFLNAPRHSKDLLRAAHAKHPELTFDVTVKVEHILEHRGIWDEMASLNVLFVVSAFESVDEATLEILDKGHTVADMSEAVDILRESGIHLRPTWLPFLPWTEMNHVVDLMRFIDNEGLGGSIDPVQLAIKLLIPRGSLLETHESVLPFLDGYDNAGLTWRWRFLRSEVEILQKQLEAIASEASDCGQEVGTTLDEMRSAVLGESAPRVAIKHLAPRLSESWFCCAEPTTLQSISIQIRPS